jgi:hypothetical protein
LHSTQCALPTLQASGTGQKVYLLVGSHPHKRANAAALMGIYSALFLGRTPEQAYAPLQRLEPFAGFRDASCGVPTYQLGVLDAIRGMWKAKEVGAGVFRVSAERGSPWERSWQWALAAGCQPAPGHTLLVTLM